MKRGGITVKPQGYEVKSYEPPTIELINVCIEKGFAQSGGNTEGWGETTGGGNF